MTADRPSTNLRRAVALMTASSFLVPAVGLLTQPVLAHALGTTGRGELAAAIAPAVLASAVATLGLPDALTYLAAKNPRAAAVATRWSMVLSVLMGLVCVVAALVSAPILSGGDAELGSLILLAMALAIPLLLVGVLRGTARGQQAWTTIAVESVVNSGLRVTGFVTLWLLGDLTVLSAVLVSFLSPIAAGLVYVPLFWRHRAEGALSSDHDATTVPPAGVGTLRFLLGFGTKVWFGSVASMLIARLDQVLMVPLSSARELGLYSVAVTVTDVPIVVAIAVSGALQGVNSQSSDPDEVVTTSRITLLLTTVGCLVLGASSAFWIVPLFGPGFAGAVVPSLILFASAVLYVPGLMAGAGLAAFGRPELRSLGFTVTLVVNLVAFVLLVPPLGVVGACLTAVLGNVVMSAFMVVAASRVVGRPARDFVLVRPSDAALTWREGLRLVRRVLRRPEGSRTAG